MNRLIPLSWLALGSVAAACTAPNVTATIENEPICPDFELGASRVKMKGGLRKPVLVSVLEDPDDDEPLSARTLLGRRTAESVTPKVLVQDSNDTYTVQWAQCENVRAPRALKAEERGADQIAAYQCGEAKPYGKIELKVRKGDPSSRVLHWMAPPEPACWTDETPKTGEEADGGAPDGGTEDESADAGDDGATASDAASSASAEAASPPPKAAPAAAPKAAPAAPPKAPKPAASPPKSAPPEAD